MTTYKMAFSGMKIAGKLRPDDSRWRKFNGSFRNAELVKSDIAGAIYDGMAFTTWHRNHWRAGNNYELGQHIGLDFDTGDISSSIPHLLKDKFIQQYATILYATPSSKPEAPKSRVLFVLDSPIMQARNYVLAVRSLLWVFGTADEKCKDPCRFFYGSNGEVEFPNHVLPLDVVKKLIGQYQTTGAEAKREHTVPTRHYGDCDGLVHYWQRRVATTNQGERNDTLNKAAYSLGQLVQDGQLSRADAKAILSFAAAQCGLPKSEAKRTIESGLRKWR